MLILVTKYIFKLVVFKIYMLNIKVFIQLSSCLVHEDYDALSPSSINDRLRNAVDVAILRSHHLNLKGLHICKRKRNI